MRYTSIQSKMIPFSCWYRFKFEGVIRRTVSMCHNIDTYAKLLYKSDERVENSQMIQ